MLVIPVTTFGLGTWQVFRLQWKLGLIDELERKTKENPVTIPTELVIFFSKFLNCWESFLITYHHSNLYFCFWSPAYHSPRHDFGNFQIFGLHSKYYIKWFILVKKLTFKWVCIYSLYWWLRNKANFFMTTFVSAASFIDSVSWSIVVFNFTVTLTTPVSWWCGLVASTQSRRDEAANQGLTLLPRFTARNWDSSFSSTEDGCQKERWTQLLGKKAR